MFTDGAVPRTDISRRFTRVILFELRRRKIDYEMPNYRLFHAYRACNKKMRDTRSHGAAMRERDGYCAREVAIALWCAAEPRHFLCRPQHILYGDVEVPFDDAPITGTDARRRSAPTRRSFCLCHHARCR